MKKKIFFVALPFIMIMGMGPLASCGGNAESTSTEEHAEHTHYACPMDCEKGKTYEEEGSCPVCGMDLEEVDS